MVSTQASTRDTGPRGRRTVRVTVQSEDVVEVEDSSSSRRGGYTVRRGGTLSGADDTEATDEDHDSDEDDLVISWARPSLDEARAACSRHIELHLSEIAGADLQWEGKLKHLLTNYERGQGALKGLLEQAAIQTVSLAADPVVLRKYHLRYKHDTNPVFDTQAHEDDVRTVRDGPSTEAKELGFERREVIQVTEEREVVKHDGHVDLWLRCAPRPRDPAQCWLKASGPSTIWERTPQIQCAQASSSFFLASGLKVLQIALAQSAECRDTLLECAAAFAEQLKPLSLFESAGPAIDEALKTLLEWLADTAAESETADRAVLILCRITSARGTFQAIASLWKFFMAHPDMMTAPVLNTIDKMFEPSEFEPFGRDLFCEPGPGTIEHMVTWWRKNVIPHVRAAVAQPGEPASEDIVLKIEQALLTGDFDRATAYVRSAVTKDSYAVLRLRPLQDFVDTAEARLYRSACEALQQQRHELAHRRMEADDIVAFFILQIGVVSLRLRPLESRWEDTVASVPICIDRFVMQEVVAVLAGQRERLLQSGCEPVSKHIVMCALRLLRLNVEAMNAVRMLIDESQAAALHSVLTRYLDIDTGTHPHCREICDAACTIYDLSQDSFLRTPEAKSATAQVLVSQYILSDTTARDTAQTMRPPSPEPKAYETTSVNVLIPLLIDRKVGNIHATPQGYVKADSGPSIVDTPTASQLLIGVASSTVMSGGGQYFLAARIDAKTTVASRHNPQGIQGLMLGLVRPNADVEGLSDDSVSQQKGLSTERWFYHPLSGTLDCSFVAGAQCLVCDEWLEKTTADFWRTPDAAGMFDCIGLLLDLDVGALFAVANGKILGKVLSGLTGEFCWAIAVGDNLALQLSAARISASDSDVSADRLLANLTSDHLAADPTALHPDLDVHVVGHLAASILASLAQRDVLSLRSIMRTASTQPSFTACVLSLWKYCAIHCDDECALGSESLDDDVDLTDATWGWEHAHESFRRRNNNSVATRQRGIRPDYAGVMGPNMESGIYEWTLSFAENGGGTWVGVASDKLPLGSGQSPPSFQKDQHGPVWWWSCMGEVGSNDRSRRARLAGLRYDVHRPIRFRLDCERQTLDLFSPASSPKPSHTFCNVACSDGVRPFSYHDFQTTVTVSDCRHKGIINVPRHGRLDTVLTTALLHRMMHLDYDDDKDVPAVLDLMAQTLAAVQGFVSEIATAPDRSSVYLKLERSGIKSLLSWTSATVSLLLCRRTQGGESCALGLLPPIRDFLTQLQASFDHCPEMMIDPESSIRSRAQSFAAEQACSVRTAEYYLREFGPPLEQAVAAYQSSSKVEPPAGWRVPCDTHWLADSVDIITGLGGEAISMLCSGLSSPSGFDVSLFSRPCKRPDLPNVQIMNEMLSSIRRPRISYRSAALDELESLVIFAMLQHAGLTMMQKSADGAGELLHCGNEALKVSQSIASLYSQAQSKNPDQTTWSGVLDPFKQRVELLLEFSSTNGAAAAVESVPTLVVNDDVLAWVPASPGCAIIESVRRFVLCGPDASEVRSVLAARASSVTEAELGYDSAVHLLNAGVMHRLGLERSWTLKAATGLTPDRVSGIWEFDSEGVACRLTLVRREAYVFGNLKVPNKTTKGAKSQRFRLSGCAENTDAGTVKVWWYQIGSEGQTKSSIRVEGTITANGQLFGKKTIAQSWRQQLLSMDTKKLKALVQEALPDSAEDATSVERDRSATIDKLMQVLPSQEDIVTITPCRGRRHKVGVFKVHGSKKNTQHSAMRGLSVTQRRTVLLQTVAKGFAHLGRLADHKVKLSSERVSVKVLELLLTEPSDELKRWCANMLLTRMDDNGAVCIAEIDDGVAIRSIMKQAFDPVTESQVCRSTTSVELQQLLVANLLMKMCTIDDGARILARFTNDLREQLPFLDATNSDAGEVLLSTVTMMRHSSQLHELLQSTDWLRYWWRVAETTKIAPSSRCMAFAVLEWILPPSVQHFQRLMDMIRVLIEPRVISDSARAVRRNAVLLVRQLICADEHGRWADLFCESFEQAVESDSVVEHTTVHVLILGGDVEIMGAGQPTENSGNVFCNQKIARCVLPKSQRLLKSVLSPQSKGSAFAVLKMVWEVGRTLGFTHLGGEMLKHVVEIARNPTEAPGSASIGTLVAKLQALYSMSDTSFQVSCAVKTVRAKSERESKPSSAADMLVPRLMQPMEAPRESLLSNKSVQSDLLRERSFVSIGSVDTCISDAEHALGVIYARLIIASTIQEDAVLLANTVEPLAVIESLGHLFKPSDFIPTLRTLLPSQSDFLDLPGLSTAFAKWLTSVDKSAADGAEVSERGSQRVGIVLSTCIEILELPLDPEDNWDEDSEDEESPVRAYLHACGLGAWYQYFMDHLRPTSIAELRAFGDDDIRRLGERAHMRMTEETREQVLTALTKLPASWKPPTQALDKRTEVDLREKKLPYEPFVLWIVEHCANSGRATPQDARKVCQRLFNLLPYVPRAARASIVHAASKFPHDALASVLAGANEELSECFAESTIMQWCEERDDDKRLLYSSLLQSLIEVGTKAGVWSLLMEEVRKYPQDDRDADVGERKRAGSIAARTSSDAEADPAIIRQLIQMDIPREHATRAAQASESVEAALQWCFDHPIAERRSQPTQRRLEREPEPEMEPTAREPVQPEPEPVQPGPELVQPVQAEPEPEPEPVQAEPEPEPEPPTEDQQQEEREPDAAPGTPEEEDMQGETATGYMARVGLDAWRPYFSQHLSENMSSVEAVRATTESDLRRLREAANMRLDEHTIAQVLAALRTPAQSPQDNKSKTKSPTTCSRDCGFKGTVAEVTAHERKCRFLSKSAMKTRADFCTMLTMYSTCRDLHESTKLPGKDWWDRVLQNKVVGDPGVKEFLKRRGLEAWSAYLIKHLDVRTIAQAQAITAADLRNMAKRAKMRLDQKTIDQVLAAIARKVKSEDSTSRHQSAGVELEEAAFEKGWTLEMDAALVNYANERARVKGLKSTGQVKPDDLFDHKDTVSGRDEESAAKLDELQPDLVALRRGTSRVPQYTAQDVSSSTSPAAHTPSHLEDMTHSSIKARWKLLMEYNALVAPALPVVDLRQFNDEGTLAHRFMTCKGRIFPDTKERFIRHGMKLTECDGPVPEVSLTFPVPGKEQEEGDRVFEQLYKQLHGKSTLRTTTGEGRLWRTSLEGASRAMWTDGTDAGGMFRSSIALLCADLRQPPQTTVLDAMPPMALLVETPNFSFGEGEGEECLQKYIPNPQAWLKSGLEDEMKDRYHFLGQLMGASARTKGFVEIDFPSMVFKFLLEEHIGLHEIREVDARTAVHLLDVRSACVDEQQWALRQAQELEAVRWRFSLVDGTEVALRGDGTERVGFSCIAEYVAMVQSKWLDQFRPQLAEIRNGFFSCFPPLVARLLTWRELQRRVCGVADVSVDALKRIARYEGTYTESDSYMHEFWKVLRSLTGEQRQQFLGFVWGRTTLPANSTTPFVIDSSGGSDDTKLPSSHTCMFQLHLPRYSSTALLKKMILLACTSAALPKSNDNRAAHRRADISRDSTENFAGPVAMPSGVLTAILRLPKDAGHKIDTITFWQRAGLTDEMAELVHAKLELKSQGPDGVAQLIRMHRSNRLGKACYQALVHAITTLSPLAALERRVWWLEHERQHRSQQRSALEAQIARLETIVIARERSPGAPPEGEPPKPRLEPRSKLAVEPTVHESPRANIEASAGVERIRAAVKEAIRHWPVDDDDILPDGTDEDNEDEDGMDSEGGASP